MRFKIEKSGTCEGYDYFVKFFEDGHRCGYVRVPEGHDLFGKDYMDMDIDINCHGGLTFSEMIEKDERGFTVGYWIGFDCAHRHDAPDIDMAKTVFGDNKFLKLKELIWLEFGFDEGGIRSFDYVESECLDIVHQLVKIQNGEKNEN